MIIMDFSQVTIASVMAQLGNHTNVDVQEDLLRHMVLNTIRTNNVKFRNEFGQLIIACDNRDYWRKKVFPFYKGHRKADREKSEINWTAIFNSINTIKEELKQFSPYPVIEVEHAEADDVIGSLCNEFGAVLGQGQEKILILSGDKDFAQLQKYTNVSQYDPVRKRKITTNDPEDFLLEHIIKGDRGDGIPNIFSDDDCIIAGNRQKPVTAKKLSVIKEQIKQQKLNGEERNYVRNRQLIDLSYVPSEIKILVMMQYSQQNNKDRSNLFNYFVKHKLKNLTECIGDF